MSATQAPAVAGANPFAQDVDERLPPPSTLVLFGATGDLAARKLLPAVYDLLADGRLPERFRLLAVVRDGRDDAWFRARAREAIDAHARRALDDRLWSALEPRIGVVAGTYGTPELFEALAQPPRRGRPRGRRAARSGSSTSRSPPPTSPTPRASSPPPASAAAPTRRRGC